MTVEARGEDESVMVRSAPRLVVAGLITVFTGLLAVGLWVVFQAQYLADYCSTRAPQPEAPTPEVVDGRPAYLDSLVTVRCDYHGLPTVVVTSALPLLGAVVLAALGLGVAVVAFRWALQPNRVQTYRPTR